MSRMNRRISVGVVSLIAALALGGCTDGGGGGGDNPVITAPKADTLILLKPGATDLNALDLREKLIALDGVETVVYDQPDKRIRVDFKDAVTDAQRKAVTDAAKADPAVADVRDDGSAPGQQPPQQQPAPGVASKAPAPTPS